MNTSVADHENYFAARLRADAANAALKIADAAAMSARETSWAADAVLRDANAEYLTAEALLIRAYKTLQGE